MPPKKKKERKKEKLPTETYTFNVLGLCGIT